MAVLTDSQRRDVWKRLQDILGKRDRALAMTKAELRTAIDEADAWVEANFADALATFTGTPSTELTTDEKKELYYLVLERRYQRISL